MGKLTDACSKGDAIGIYRALRADMARMMEDTESGRDYAAIAKSLIVVQEKIDALNEEARQTKAARRSPLAKAQGDRLLKVVGG